MAPRTRNHHTALLRVLAECLEPGCRWELDSRNAHGLGVQHHDRTGHEVRIETTRSVRYGTTKTPDAADVLPLGDPT